MKIFALLIAICIVLPSVAYAVEINETIDKVSIFSWNGTSEVNESGVNFIKHLEFIPLSCPYDSCSGNDSDVSREFRACSCDKDCKEFRDCCHDSEYYDETEQQKPSVYECQSITNHQYFIVSTCASSWKDEEILENCVASRNHDLNAEDIELRIPASSVATNITYGNIFCAVCNYEVDDIQMWNVTIENFCASSNRPCLLPNFINKSLELSTHCKQLEDPSSLNFNGSRWYFVDNQTSYYCDLTLVPPTNVQLKFCSEFDSTIVSSCLKNWTDFSVMERCNGPYSRIYDAHGNAYRNRFCAYCNGFDDFKLTCAPIFRLSSEVSYSMRSGITASFSGHRAFSVLFDFKSKKHTKICGEKKHSYSEVKKQLCPNDENDGIIREVKNDNWFFTSYTSIAVLTSLVFLILHLTIFSVVKELHTIGGKNIASFCLALVLAYSSFLFGNHVKGDICFVIAVIMYYSFLSAFLWMLTISYDMWQTFWNATKKFRSPRNLTKKFFIYSLWSWSVPLMPALVAVYLDLFAEKVFLAPHFGESGCWFDNGYALLSFFVAPVCVIIVVNFCFFLHISCMLHNNQCESVNQKSRVDFKLYARIALLTGFTWITGFVAGFTQSMIAWFIFIVLNTAQGVLIFTAFSCKKRIILSFLKRIGKFEAWQESLQESKAKSNATTSTMLNSIANETM